MSQNILVAVAWPYANSDIHVGNITGSYLPADIFARFQRLSGNQVIMVSGSDAHGTPVTVRADAEGTTPLVVYQKYHSRFIELFQKHRTPLNIGIELATLETIKDFVRLGAGLAILPRLSVRDGLEDASYLERHAIGDVARDDQEAPLALRGEARDRGFEPAQLARADQPADRPQPYGRLRVELLQGREHEGPVDRKSTRLNSSHRT